ncbi:Hypothetical predicted protein [Olea europaea subsp. europaea]|uniref:Uncharacterized protein n=1 Tax=Olea europaea subsp. europaea TaxID=158383 RepID=A0A8S0T251_OLEEU|nr:Hypothetical predicted protein [Olea europaea subsp. europaea]
MIFKLDESDFLDTTVRSISSEFQKANSRISRKKSSVATGVAVNGLAYLLMNIPDWLKILKEEYRVNHWRDFDEDDFEDDDEDSKNWVPPHEFLARQTLRMRTASFSLHEGLVIQREFCESNYRGFMRESEETPFFVGKWMRERQRERVGERRLKNDFHEKYNHAFPKENKNKKNIFFGKNCQSNKTSKKLGGKMHFPWKMCTIKIIDGYISNLGTFCSCSLCACVCLWRSQ